MSKIVVIGGGVVGTSIAYHLAKAGQSVTLLEREHLAAQASGASAGGVRQIGRDPREMPIAISAMERWSTLETELDANVEFRMGGQLLVAESEDKVPELRRRFDSNRAAGLDVALLRGDDVRRLAPSLAPSAQWALYTSNDGQASAPLTTMAFGRAAQRLGATIVEGATVQAIVASNGKVTGVQTDDGVVGCEWLVLAAGAWTNVLLEPLGHRLPITTMALQMMAVGPMEHILEPTVGAVGRHLSLKQVPDGHFVIGGGWPGDASLEQRTWSTRLDSIRGSIEHSTAILPALGNLPLVRTWIGIEALALDEVPIIGPLDGLDNLTVAAGFSGHGFALSPMTGQLVAELIVDGWPSMSLDAFRADRFPPETGTEEFPGYQAG